MIEKQEDKDKLSYENNSRKRAIHENEMNNNTKKVQESVAEEPSRPDNNSGIANIGKLEGCNVTFNVNNLYQS